MTTGGEDEERRGGKHGRTEKFHQEAGALSGWCSGGHVEEKPAQKTPKVHGSGTPWGGVTLGDIIASGLLRPPVDLYRRYKGHDLTARIEQDGRVTFGGTVYGSPSVAAQNARRTVIGADKRAQTNGWTFWNYKDDAGQRQKPDTLRQRLWESRTSR